MLPVFLRFLPDPLTYVSVFSIGLIIALVLWGYSPLVPLCPKSIKQKATLLWLSLLGLLFVGFGLVAPFEIVSRIGVFCGGVLWCFSLFRYFLIQVPGHQKRNLFLLLPYLSVSFIVSYWSAWGALVGLGLVNGGCLFSIFSFSDENAERKSLLKKLGYSFFFGVVFLTCLYLGGFFVLPGVFLFLFTNIYVSKILKDLACLDSQTTEEISVKNGILRQDNERVFEENETLSTRNTKLNDEHKALMEAYDALIAQNAKAEADLLEQMRASNILDHLKQSVDYARRIQNGVFYSEKEICEAFPEAFIIQKPRDVVSGDFVWFSRISDDEVIIAAIDCTGHGVPGAFMTIMGNGLMHTIVNQQGVTRPDQILFLLDHRIRESLSRQGGEKVNDGMDLSLCKVNFKSREILFSGARNPLCVVEDGDVTLYKGTRRSIGGNHRKPAKKGESPYDLQRVQAKSGQSFYIYSDGFQDQLGGLNRTKYMARRFRSFLKWNQSQSMDLQKTALERELKTWQHKEMQTDDILVIGFKVI